MEESVVFKFEVFDESIIQEAMKIITEIPGNTLVKINKKEGKLKVTGEFDKNELIKKLRNIDKNVDMIEDEPEPYPEVNKQHNPKMFLSNFNHKGDVTKKSDDPGSSNWTTLQPYELWNQAKVVGMGVAGQAKVIGAGMAELLKNKEKAKAPEPKGGNRGGGKAFHEPQLDYQKKGGGVIANVVGFIKNRKEKNEQRLIQEWIKEEDMNQKKDWHINKYIQEKINEVTQKKEGGTSQELTKGYNTMGFTKYLTNIGSTLSTGQASTSMKTVSTRQATTSTQKVSIGEEKTRKKT